MRTQLVVALAIIAAGPLAAQESSPPVEAVLVPAAAQHHLIRFRVDQAIIIGRLTSVSGGQATLTDANGTRAVSLGRIDSVWVRGYATKKGAIIGGVVGAVSLGVLGALFSGLCEGDCSGAAVGAAALGGAIGFGTGALIGAGFGALIPIWKLRVP